MAKLLLVEDDNNLREIYEARLSAEGYEISTAQNGEEALSIAKQLRPDLIISDVMMPRISGFEMLDILRNTDELKNTKVIMLTALGQAEDRSRADNLGADKYLVKSQVTLEDIVQAAHELLEGSEEVMEPAAIPAPVQAVSVPEPVAELEPLAVAEPVVAPAPAPVEMVAPMPAVTPQPVMEVPTAPMQVVEVAEPPMMAPEPPQPTSQPSLVTPFNPEPFPEPVAPPMVAPVLDASTDDTASTTTTALPTEDESNDLVLPQVTPPATFTQPEPFATPPEPVAATPLMPPSPEQPVSPEQVSNDAVLEAAINNLTTEPVSETYSSVPVASTSPTTAPINPSEPTGRKVISPITDPTQGPDINALLAQEEAQATNQVTAPAPSSTIAPSPASSPTENPSQPPTAPPTSGIDPNSISL